MDEAKFLVKIPQGTLLGREFISELNGFVFYAFLGIPYAKPPIGNLRFMPPEPPSKWHGIRPAKKAGSDCMHKVTFDTTVLGSEDCLYLNVFTPQAPCDIKTPKAVVVVIHCGGMAWGSGSPDYFGGPDFIMNRDIVFVTFNYRLHVFGFLNLELPNCAGNMGMKDMVMALQWVQKNIKYFGGDPDNVTLYGNSSSASVIHLLMMSSMSKGLFHKSVMQGGYALSPLWSYMEDHLERAFELAKYLDFKGNNTKRLLRFMKQLPAETIIDGLDKFRKELKSKITGRIYNSIFLTSIEAFVEGAFLSQCPRDLLYSIESKPILWNIASSEGIHALVGSPWNLQLRNIIKENLWMYKINDKTLDVLVERIKSFYFGEHDVGRDTIKQIVELFSDMWYCEWYDVLDYQASIPNSHPLYIYSFSFVGQLNVQRHFFTKFGFTDNLVGASHGDDSPYIIHYKVNHRFTSLSQNLTKRERKVIDNMCKMTTNFAKNANPNGELSEDVDWKPYNKDDPEYLEFGENLQIKKGFMHGNRTKFWRELTEFIKANEAGDTLIDNIDKMRINEQTILFISFCFYGLIISAAYQAALASLITIPMHGKELHDVREILNSSLGVYGSPEMRRIIGATAETSNISRQILTRFQLLQPQKLDDIVQRVIRKRDISLVGVKRSLYYYSLDEAKRLKVKIPFRLIPGCLMRPHSTHFMFRRGSHLVKPMNSVLNRLFESGITAHWILHLGMNRPLPVTQFRDRTLCLVFFREPLQILVGCYIVAILVFVVEVVWQRQRQQRANEQKLTENIRKLFDSNTRKGRSKIAYSKYQRSIETARRS